MKNYFFALLFAAITCLADDSTFLNTDVFELEVADSPQISPDASRIVYVRKSMDIMSDRAVSNLWIINTDGSEHRPLVTGPANYGSPRWSPSGDRLAFVSEVEGRGSQIHVRWMDSGQTTALTNIRSGPSNLAWSPDGSQIAFEMFVAEQAELLIKPPATPEGARWAPPVTVIERIRYRADGAGFLPMGYSHLFVLSADGGTPRQLTHGPLDNSGPLSWSRDGKQLYFSSNLQDEPDYDPLESEIWSISLASGEKTALTNRDGPDFAPTVSPDGSKLAYLGFDDRRMIYHNAIVYLMNLNDGTNLAISADFDRRIDSVQWAGDSDELLIQYDDHGRRHIATLTTKGKITSLASDLGGVALGRPYTSGNFSVASNGAYAYTAGRPDRPADVATGRGSRAPKRITDLNDDLLGHKQLASIEEISWPSSHDQLEVQGWIAKPPGFDPGQKYPLMLEIHGGPVAAYGPQFSAEVQLYAAAGYVVLYINPRGSSSYGAEFANQIHLNYPGQDYDDLMSGVDAVIDRGYVDEESLYVTGGSGGGVLTAWIVGKTDRFRAAVVAKPVIDWTSFSLVSDGAPLYSMYWFDQPPWEAHEKYWARSPLSLVGNVSTPTALLSGESDLRTPISQAEEYYQALKMRKVDTVLIRVPEASHGIAARPSHLIAKVDNILAWFSRYQNQ